MEMERVRILAIDDSPCGRAGGHCVCVGVLSNGGVVEGVLTFGVRRDGNDATDKIMQTVRKSKFGRLVKLLMLHSVTVAGLNIVNICKLNSDLQMPILCITREKPTENSLSEAIKKVFKDGRSRKGKLLALEAAGKIREHNKMYFQSIGLTEKEAFSILDSFGAYPWNLRLAHLIATAIVSGESHGKA